MNTYAGKYVDLITCKNYSYLEYKLWKLLFQNSPIIGIYSVIFKWLIADLIQT